jgi:hypothetical protein
MTARQREIIATFPPARAAVPPVTRLRSTLITSSLKTLEQRGLLEAYFGALPPRLHDAIRGTIAGLWLPIDVAAAHYRACDALRLTPAAQIEIGRSVGEKIRGTLLGTLVGLAKGGGASPWTFLERLDRLYERLVVGGAIVVSRSGPKDAVVEVFNVPLFEIPYFATAWRGVIQGMCELFCTKVYVKNGQLSEDASTMTYRIAWA